MFANFGMFDLEPPPPPIALSADDAGLPPLFRALLGGDSARAIELLEHGADACEALPSCGATPLHAAGLGGCAADAVAALVAAGAPLEAQLTEPGVQLCYSVSGLLPTRAPAGSTPLTVACGRPHVATAEALLAAGAACEPPVLNNSQFVRFDAASPWHWLEKHSCSHEHKAAVNALRAHMLALMRQRHAAGTLALQPEQLLGWVGAAALRPPCSEELAAVVALPSAAGMLSEEQHRRLADVVVQSGDVAAVEALQAGPLRLQPLDPDGSMLRGTCITLRGEATVPMARALLQHGTVIPLTTINTIIEGRANAPLLELLLLSGLPLPRVPRGSRGRPVAMWDGEYGTPNDYYDVCCPFYTLFRRDYFGISKTPHEMRVRMCQALLRAGYRPTVYRSLELQVLDAEEGGYTPQCLPDFHVLKDWGRLGLTAGGRERVCCFPGADPCQDKLLVGDNRLLWMLIEGEPWSPADHHHWPPAFRAAARTLLLAHRRGAPVQGAAGPSAALVELQSNPLARLPLEFVLGVIQQAAFPLDAWFDAASAESWRATEFYSSLEDLGLGPTAS